MLPTYKEGDVVVGLRRFTPKVGQVVVVRVTEQPLIKRIKRIEPAGVWLEGDNQSKSVDSKNFGYVQPNDIESVILFKV